METERCPICDKVAFSKVSVPLVSATESGKVLDIFTNKEQSLNMIIPLCPYHFIWASEGFVAVLNEGKEKGKILIPGHEKDKIMESYSDDEIKQSIKEHEGLEDYSKGTKLAKAILSGRKFELDFIKNMKKCNPARISVPEGEKE